MAINNPIFRSTEASIKPSTFTRANTIPIGGRNCPASTCRGVLSARIFPAEGILEDQIRVGDRIRIGSAEFIVTQPRMPCYKLGIRFNRRDIVKRFLESKRTGFYVAVLREGEVESGDAIEFIEKQETGVTITEIVNLYSTDAHNQELLRRATELPALPQSWKDYFRKRLWNADS